MMSLLDCENPESALASLAAAARMDAGDLRGVLTASKPSEIDWDSEEDEPPSTVVARRWLSAVGVELEDVTFDGSYFFHGTRTLRPHSFLEHGIRPLGSMLDAIWDDLHSLSAEQVTTSQWSQMRSDLESVGRSDHRDAHSAWLYRFKTSDESMHGPYASLTRDYCLDPPAGNHDYLKSPEIIEDIMRSLGLGLQERFEEQARSCIVKFAHARATAGDVEAALHYVHAAIHGEPMGLNAMSGVDCRGLPVAAAAVVYVDEIDLGARASRGSVPLFRHEPSVCAAAEWPCSAAQ